MNVNTSLHIDPLRPLLVHATDKEDYCVIMIQQGTQYLDIYLGNTDHAIQIINALQGLVDLKTTDKPGQEVFT